MTTENRDFKGVWISKEVWLDARLSAIEKIILTEIDSFDSGERGCWASNKYIADFCQCSERTVSSAISKLIKLGYLYVQSFDGRQRELKSKFTKPIIIVEEGSEICEADLQDKNNLQNSLENNAKQGSKICEADLQNLQQSNTSNNTINNTSNNKQERKKESKQSTYDEILNSIEPIDLRELYFEYIKMRKMIKSPMTDRALKMLISKVTELEPNSIDNQKKLLETAIINNWKSVYPLKVEQVFRNNNNNNTGNIFLEIAEDEGIL